MASRLFTCATCGRSLDDLSILSPDVSISAHRHLLNSNDPPPQRDVPSIRDTIRETELEISRIDELLEDLATARKLVLSRRAERVKQAMSYRGLLSSIRNFPAELLAEIFLHCVSSSFQTTLSVNRPPWVFGKVCRRWRSIALASPQLWGILPDFHNNALASNNVFYHGILSTSLKLSRTVPLSLHLSPYSYVTPTYPVLNILSLHAHRCRSLTISTTSVCLPLLHNAFEHIKSLYTLILRFLGGHQGFKDHRCLATFQHSSKLRSLQINAPTSTLEGSEQDPFTHSWFKIPWYNVTSFSGGSLQLQFINDLIANAPCLIECSFTDIRSHRKSTFRSVHHTRLRKFKLHFDPTHWDTKKPILQSAVPLLDSLDLPSLVDLSVTPGCGINVASLASFILRSSCSLSTLVLEGSDFKGVDSDLPTLLKATPSLSHLKLHFLSGTHEGYLEHLTGQPTEGAMPLLPQLQYLTAYAPSLKHWEVITQFIQSRSNLAKELGSKALERVTLETKDDETAWTIFNKLDGWKDGPQDYLSYGEFIQRLRLFQDVSERSRPLRKQDVLSLDEALTVIEVQGVASIPPQYLRRSRVCDSLRRIAELSADDFEEEASNQYRIGKRAGIILESWRAILDTYLQSPGWSRTKTTLLYSRRGHLS